jgi:large subunit ribosomal protein L30
MVVAVAVALVVDVMAVVAVAALAVVEAEQEVADVAEANSNAEGKRIKITLVRSVIGYPQNQRDAIRTLGLHRMHETVEHPDSPTLRGQLFKVKHLIQVEES